MVKKPDKELQLVGTSLKLPYKKTNKENAKERGLSVKIILKHFVSVAKISQFYNKFPTKK